MIFITEQLLNDNKKFLNLIDDEIALNQASLKSQKALKGLLLDYMQKLATSTIVKSKGSSKILSVLVSFKNSFELSKTNIINLENLISLFNDIKNSDNAAILANINDFNSTIIYINAELFKNNSEILQTLKLTLSYSNELGAEAKNIFSTITTELEKTSNEVITNIENTSIETTSESESISNKVIANSENASNEVTAESENISNDVTVNTENTSIDVTANSESTSIEVTAESENTSIDVTSESKNILDEKTAEVENTNIEASSEQTKIQEDQLEPITIKENTLIISEKTNKVFLPYSCNSLEKVYETNPEVYSSVEDIIRKDFIVPLDSYKIPSLSRFRESYKLMREKENKSFKESLDLAFELFFNYNLHPAIISACRNLDELDIYLDYLSDNETHKFNCFDIVFEVAPTTISKHSIRHKRMN